MTRFPFQSGPYAGLWGLASVLAARRQRGTPPPHYQYELARALGYHPDHFSRFVAGRVECPLALVADVCRTLACTPRDLQPPLPQGGEPPLNRTPCAPALAGTPGRAGRERRAAL